MHKVSPPNRGKGGGVTTQPTAHPPQSSGHARVSMRLAACISKAISRQKVESHLTFELEEAHRPVLVSCVVDADGAVNTNLRT